MSDDDLLDIPAFLRREPGNVRPHREATQRVRYTMPGPRKPPANKGQTKQLLKQGWSKDQISRITATEVASAIESGVGPIGRFGPPKGKE